MKKLLLVLALASTSAFAQNNVQLYGRMSEFVDSSRTGTAGYQTRLRNDQSFLGVKVGEDLGQGFKLNGTLETFVLMNDPTTSATQLGDKQATLGVSNKYGFADFGRKEHSLFAATKSTDPFGLYYGSIADDVHGTRGRRFSNGTFFAVTPITGLSVNYDRSLAANTRDAYSTGVGYQEAYWSANATYFNDPAARAKTTLLGGSITIPMTETKISASLGQHKDAGLDRTSRMIGVNQPLVSGFSAKASYGTTAGLTAYNVGGQYDFSKRTNVSVVYTNENFVNNTRDNRAIGFGLTHSF